jgi:hypothetical protein
MLPGLLYPEGARERMSIYFRIARPPKAQSLPLIVRNVGRSAGSSQIKLLQLATLRKEQNVRFWHKGGHHGRADLCPLLGVKQALGERDSMSA